MRRRHVLREREKPLALYGPEPFEQFFNSITDVWGEWMLGDYPTEVPVGLGKDLLERV